MRRIVPFVSCAVVAVVLVSVAPGGRTGTGPSGVILYSDSKPHGGVPGIYLVRPASGAVKPLRGRFFHGSRPAWSPDGSKLVFERWRVLEDSRSSRFGWDLVIARENGSGVGVLVPFTDR